MIRLSLATGFAVLVLSVASAFAQEVGGEPLSAEMLATPGAQEQALNRAFALFQRAQIAQQMLLPRNAALGGLPVAPPANPNAVNPSADRPNVNQQMMARLRGDAGFLAGFSGGQPLALSRAKPVAVAPSPTFVDQSQTLVVNAVDSPVSIGDGNIVRQHVANSTAVSLGSPATSTAAVPSRSGQGRSGQGHRGKPDGASVAQAAISSATSNGGVAQSSASNTSIVGR